MKYSITCGTITVRIGQKEIKELEYLARWTADLYYIRERFGADDPAAEVSRGSIKLAFELLDKLGVPYWLQNSAMYFAEDWRRYRAMSLWKWLALHYQVNEIPD